MANGDAIPSKVTGMESRINTEVKEANKMPNCSWSNASAARLSTGRETNGTIPIVMAAQIRI